jgi:hypothetical protein
MNEVLNKLNGLIKVASGPSSAGWGRAQRTRMLKTTAGVVIEFFEGRGQGYTRHTIKIAREDLPRVAAGLLEIYNSEQAQTGLKLVGKTLRKKVS